MAFFGFRTAEDLRIGRELVEAGADPPGMVDRCRMAAYEAFLRGELNDGSGEIYQAGQGTEAAPRAAVRRTRDRQKHLAFDE